MSIFGSIRSIGTWTLDKLGLDWVTKTVPIEDPVAAVAAGRASTVSFVLTMPEYVGTNPVPFTQLNFLNFAVPNHSTEFGSIAINMAQNALNLLEMCIALQNVVDEEGGLRIKDQLDPYHYEVIRRSLEENGETVPPVREPQANVATEIGGAITSYGLLSNAGTIVDGLSNVESLNFLAITPQTADWNPAIGFNSTDLDFAPVNPMQGSFWGNPLASWPDYSYPLAIMNSAVAVQGLVLQYAVSIFRNVIDTESRAILLKGVLGEFSKDVSDQAQRNVGVEPPAWEEPQGQSGIF